MGRVSSASGNREEKLGLFASSLCVHVCRSACACVYMHVETRGHLKYSSLGFVHFHFETRFLTGLELAS